jgi:hypothetical protein
MHVRRAVILHVNPTRKVRLPSTYLINAVGAIKKEIKEGEETCDQDKN